MAGAMTAGRRQQVGKLGILVVDPNPQSADEIRVASSALPCEVIECRSLSAARTTLKQRRVELVVCRQTLEDGEASDLLPATHTRRWDAPMIIMGERPSAEQVLRAFRCGAADYLCLPMDPPELLQRMRRVLQNQAITLRTAERTNRLRSALRKMNESRKLISQRVDVLCRDLVTAYGQLANDLDEIRNQEGYRHAIAGTKDLEQLICSTMDWLLKRLGPCNVGIWLRGVGGEFELGAYMRHSVAATKPLLKAVKAGLVQKTVQGSVLVRGSAGSSPELSKEERELLAGHSVLTASTTFLGETIGVLVLFKAETTPFTQQQQTQLMQVLPILGNALSHLMNTETNVSNDVMPDYDEREGRDEREERDNADWWKRGESPPF